MPDLILIIQKWWKPIVAFTVIATLLAALLVMLLPKQYLSVATALPASGLATDKSSIFNENIQELYTSLGTPDELDRFLGTAALDTLYIATADTFNLKAHYGVKQNDHTLYNAARKLKKNTNIIRSEYGELKVQVWDKDRQMAAALANTLMQKLQHLHGHLQSSSNSLVLQKLRESYTALQQPSISDSATQQNTTAYSSMTPTVRQEQMNRYQKLMAEYDLMVNTRPPALLIVEPARPAVWADKPYVWLSIGATFFAAALFSLLLATILESRRTTA